MSIFEGLRRKVVEPKIKYWKLHELYKNARKICIPYKHMTQILKFLNFQQLLKHILRASSCLGGAIAILWVRPLYFSALHLVVLISIFFPILISTVTHVAALEC